MAGRIPKIVVVGPTYVDMVIKCKEFPSPGEVVDGFGASCVPTGAGPNRAVEAALCDCDVTLISKVGEDPFGEMAKANLRRYRINTELVYINTFFKLISKCFKLKQRKSTKIGLTDFGDYR